MTADSFEHSPDETTRRSTPERVLLTLATVFMVVSLVSLTLSHTVPRLMDWMSFGVWLICAVFGSRFLERYLPGCDPFLFPVTLFLSGWGLVIINRLAPPFADRQSLWLLLSTGALLTVAVSPLPLRWLRNYRYVLLVVGLGLLLATIILGTNPSGAAGAPQHWLGIAGIYFQPSEALKIILVAFLASYLGEQYPTLRADGLAEHTRRFALSPRIAGPILLMWGLSVVILVWQRDLGTAVLFFVVFLLLLYVASGYTWIIPSGVVLITIAGYVGYYLFDVVRLRVDIWLNPWPEADGRAFQIVQSLQAFAAGGVFGQGVGQGAPTYIPVVHSDFVFAAIAEEWGLLGVIVVIACLGILVMRGLRIATLQQARPFFTLLSVGLSLLLGVQSLLIMCGILKLLPLTGVTLPFLSYGGSSLLASFVTIGLLLRLSAGRTES